MFNCNSGVNCVNENSSSQSSRIWNSLIAIGCLCFEAECFYSRDKNISPMEKQMRPLAMVRKELRHSKPTEEYLHSVYRI